jgi:hypothetical protein
MNDLKEWLDSQEFRNFLSDFRYATPIAAHKSFAALKAAILAGAEPREDTKNAARYRWLRDQFWVKADLFVVSGSKSRVLLGTDCPSQDRLDAAIDAAMESHEKGLK